MTRKPPAAPHTPRPHSLRRRLLLGILLPVVVFITYNTISAYQQTLASLNTAYDRTLLASAKSISEQLDVTGYEEAAHLRAIVPYSALEAFEADNKSRMYYRVSNLQGELISGFDELPLWKGTIPARPPYAALVDFYDDTFRGLPVRVAVLLQPVASSTGRAMAVIQVAETLEVRETLALQNLRNTLLRQALLIAVIGITVVLVVQRATQPVRQLSQELQARQEGDLSPITAPAAPRELQPLIEGTNEFLQRLRHLLRHQKRFVRDASHQLRTPLAVLKTQVQSALRGDMPAEQALHEIRDTVDRATQLANQMLALAKVEQLRQQSAPPVTRFDEILRGVALEISPLIAQRDLDFGIHTDAAPIVAHEWMLRELTRNLLHNAVRHAPPGSELSVELRADGRHAALTVSDHGPGIDDELALRLFQPFSAGDVRTGSGLGLAICQEIVQALGGSIALTNRTQAGRVLGLDAVVRLPLATSADATTGAAGMPEGAQSGA
ncbi:two-component system sensor histidine kinase TctE [Acidovorax soli]|jgi:two-component system sensor histidine kinase TctE|uniref:histidine kinase n=1 Tax=Acidovorax soli TaxID=592050 RepID=A0A7X0PI65_9BURK|nr:sensor histidine kinase [Acidovorax soli]MBB6561861.1 two-component system sensor histidine kinase TctE [Acidovorax soli]